MNNQSTPPDNNLLLIKDKSIYSIHHPTSNINQHQPNVRIERIIINQYFDMSTRAEKESEESKSDDATTLQQVNESIENLKISSQNIIQRELFGGAIIISVPEQWRDVSLVRQIPDHQECYQDCTFQDGSKFELQGTGGCLVVEILGREEDVKDEDAALFFFRDLAEANGPGYSEGDVTFNCVGTVGCVPGTGSDEVKVDNEIKEIEKVQNLIPKLSAQRLAKVCSCVGYQSIGPLKNKTELEDGKANRIRVELCAVRLAAVDTDILVTLSMPCDNEKNSTADDGDTNKKETALKRGDGHGHSSLFIDILDGFNVLDWRLFG